MAQDSKPAKPSINSRRRARSLLLQALYQWQLGGAPVNEIEAQFRSDNSGKIDWGFFHEALTTVSRQTSELDAHFAGHLDRQVSELNPIELALLRLGSFELARRIDVPYRVVINEYVELAKVFGATDSHKYVNGVLDKAARQLRAIEIEARRREQSARAQGDQGARDKGQS